jgi:hypothetical protein
MSNVDVEPTPRTPPGSGDEPDVQVPEIRDPPNIESISEGDDEHDKKVLARARALFSGHAMRGWADYIAAEEEETREKIARLRAARLAREIS